MIVVFTFFCVMVVTAVLFGGWVIMSVIRLIGRIFRANAQPGSLGTQARCCGNPGCRTINPVHANYCRRCGSNLTEALSTRPSQQRPPRYNPATGRGRQVANV